MTTSADKLVRQAVLNLLRLENRRGEQHYNLRLQVLSDLADSGKLGSHFPDAAGWTKEGGPIPESFRKAIADDPLARFVK